MKEKRKTNRKENSFSRNLHKYAERVKKNRFIGLKDDLKIVEKRLLKFGRNFDKKDIKIMFKLLKQDARLLEQQVKDKIGKLEKKLKESQRK